MFVLVFRWRIKPEARNAFLDSWSEVTTALKAQGSHGSALFDGPDGTVCAIARWPDRATREASSARSAAPGAWSRMRELIVEELFALELDGVVNLWTEPEGAPPDQNS